MRRLIIAVCVLLAAGPAFAVVWFVPSPKPGAEEAVTVFNKDGLKIEAFLVSHDPAEPAYGYRITY